MFSFQVRFLSIAFFVCLAVLVGCKSADPTPTDPITSITGNYKLTEALRIQGIVSQETLFVFGSSCTDALVVTFNAGNTVTTNKPAACENASYESSTLVRTFTDAKWAISDNTMSLTTVGQTKTDFQ
ncbi:hypothetical protein ACAW74_08725 [Fibrella sp. WM1]|uniref:hypothetical protein n=1 Tax=Fibrella musci TaxID=3242485 RepID=UPI003522418A